MPFMALEAAKDPGVVCRRTPISVLLDVQLFPLTAELQELQNVVEGHVQRELRLKTPSPHVQVQQDNFLKLF
jgi:hypothetical protein